MEDIIPVTNPNLKKQWQKPDFYILDSNSVNGGVTFSNNVEEGNGFNQIHPRANPANIYNTLAIVYNQYVAS